jgi:hypothetical protein
MLMGHLPYRSGSVPSAAFTYGVRQYFRQRCSMHRFKLIVIIMGSCLLLAGGYLLWNEHAHAMRVARPFAGGDTSRPQQVLIATQGSAFKDALVAGIVAALQSRPIYIRVIDVSALRDVHDNDWKAIIIVHTWEFGRAQGDARVFVDRVPDKRKLIVVTTSGGGREKLPGIDAISAASVMDDTPARVTEIIDRLDAILQ